MGDIRCGVLVAVGPDGAGDGTLDFAVAEAQRRETGVELLHVVHSLVVSAREERIQAIDRSLTAVGRRVLSDVSARLRGRLVDRLPVSTQLLTGPVSATIVERASDADLIVLERRDASKVDRLLTMSISTRVAARADRPVAVVPSAWRSDPTVELPVTVGVDRPLETLEQVETAAGYARMAGRPLTVLHAVWVAEAYQDAIGIGRDREEWVREATTRVELDLATLTDRESVDLTTDVRWARPVDALVAASQASSLLVLSRRGDGHVMRGALGGITRAVLQHTRCPVLIVDRT